MSTKSCAYISSHPDCTPVVIFLRMIRRRRSVDDRTSLYEQVMSLVESSRERVLYLLFNRGSRPFIYFGPSAAQECVATQIYNE